MSSRSSYLVYALLLGGAWAGCTSPPPVVSDPGETPSTSSAPSGVVVIGASRDGSATEPDAAVPSLDGSSGSEPTGSGEIRPHDGGAIAPGDSASAQPPLEGGGATEAGGPTAIGDGAADAGTVAPSNPPDASSPPTVVDAGLPPVVDAGPPPVVDAGPPPVVDAGRVGCLAGRYKGTFAGEISALLGLVRIDVAGDITIDVDLVGAPGDRLQIRNGLLQGTDTSEQRNPLFARISGVLNCATKQLENGSITDGTYNRVDPIWGGPPTTTTFTGTITGNYVDNPPSAAGTWQVQNDTGTRTSVGTWNAALE